MNLKETCQAKKNKTTKESWDEINERFGYPYKHGDSLRGAFNGGRVSSESPNVDIKEGEEERKPKLEDMGDYYIVNSGKRSVEITKDKLRQLKKFYCRDKNTMNRTALELGITREEFVLVKNAFGVTKDDIPYIDEDLDNIDALVEETIVEKKRAYWTKLQERENATLKKEVEKYRQRDYLIEKIAEENRKVFENLKVPNIIIGERPHNGQMLEFNNPDLHLGKLGWAAESTENYDHKIAAQRFNWIVEETISRLQGERYETILFPIGNDFFNFDNPEGETTKGTLQDNDLRWAKMFPIGKGLMACGMENMTALGPVEGFYMPGNHDYTTSFYLTDTLSSWFRNSDCITINTSPNPRKYTRYGVSCIGFTHLDKEKNRVFGNMQNEVPKMWANTIFHEFHGAHLHSEHVKEQHGVIARNLSSVTGRDFWHHQYGYTGAIARVQHFIYDKKNGPDDIMLVNLRK